MPFKSFRKQFESREFHSRERKFRVSPIRRRIWHATNVIVSIHVRNHNVERSGIGRAIVACIFVSRYMKYWNGKEKSVNFSKFSPRLVKKFDCRYFSFSPYIFGVIDNKIKWRMSNIYSSIYFGKKDKILFFETFIFAFERIEFENWPNRNGLLVQCYSVCGNKLEIFEVFEKIIFKDCSNKLINK